MATVSEDPFFDAGVRGWIVKTAYKHYWRVSSYYEFDDLVQDGYLCYAKCLRTFRPKGFEKHADNWGCSIGDCTLLESLQHAKIPLHKDDTLRFMATFQNDQTGTLKAYWSDDGGANWTQYDAQTVSIPASNKSSQFDYEVDLYRDWKLDFVNDATAQTTWKGNLVLGLGERAAAV